jgi:hypothetical protein
MPNPTHKSFFFCIECSAARQKVTAEHSITVTADKRSRCGSDCWYKQMDIPEKPVYASPAAIFRFFPEVYLC